MSKYTFERLGADRFETMVQALLEKRFRVAGGLVQFGPGKDGGREATWTQPAGHELYSRPANADRDIDKEWVFQAKYHDIGTRGWDNARTDVTADLRSELNKIANKHKVPCHKYVLATNVPFSGVRFVGTRDKVDEIRKAWLDRIPEIEVWDATDLSRMLDADTDTRTAYLDALLPGDVLQSLLTHQSRDEDRRRGIYRTYLKSILRSERDARAEEAGDDESSLHLENVFVDLEVELVPRPSPRTTHSLTGREPAFRYERHAPTKVPSSLAFLRAGQGSMVLKGGPGVGKSTLTQFLALYHAARLVDEGLALRLASRLKLESDVPPEALDADCRVRFPLRVELRRYAQWMAEPSCAAEPFLAKYIAEQIRKAAGAEGFGAEDVFDLVRGNAVLLILDGLDEVPQPELRDLIFTELQTFLMRCDGDASDVQTLLSTRPQGYQGEFDGFRPFEWHVVDLALTDFYEYVDRWLEQRIANDDERADARQRIDEGMRAPAVQQLATTLLQATVMLTIAQRKHAIPHARHKLYEKYVDVIFQRERNKKTVRERGDELRELHSIIGFRLISRMGKPIARAEFEQCVNEVIQDFGSKEIGGGTFRTVREEISKLAKDRLCLLAGKGEDQEHIDFVIQPFREYFAADYLARHEDADADRVFASLVQRASVWGNVLQFYAAFQSKAQQKSWVLEAEEDREGLAESHYVALVRTRRALLQLFPEFERPKNSEIRRAFRALLDRSTRWTWFLYEDMLPLLTVHAPVETFRLLEETFGELSKNDPRALYVELDLLAKAAGPGEAQRLQNKLEELIADPRTRTPALRAALVNDVAVSLVDCATEELEGLIDLAMERARHSDSRFLSKTSEGQAADLLFSFAGPWEVPLIKAHEALGQVWKTLSEPGYSVDVGGMSFVLPPSLRDRSDSVPDELVDHTAKLRSRVSPYLTALLHAVNAPLDPERYERAVHEEQKIAAPISRQYSVWNQLGPGPSTCGSVEEWRAVRRRVYEEAEAKMQSWGAQLSDNDGSWCSLYLSPAVWSELGPIVDRERYEVLLGQIAPAVREVSSFLDGVAMIRQRGRPHGLAPFSLIRVVLDIATKYGAEHTPVALEFLRVPTRSRGVARIAPANVANRLLREAIDSPLPAQWAAVLLGACAGVPGVSVSLLLKLWERRASDDWWFVRPNSEVPADVVEELLATATRQSVTLAAELRGQPRAALPRATDLDDRLVTSLVELIESSRPPERNRYVELLLRQPGHIRELSLWENPEMLGPLAGGWWPRSLSSRLHDILGSADQRALPAARRSLSKLLDRREFASAWLANAALEGILRIDELLTPPLEDSDWQKKQ